MRALWLKLHLWLGLALGFWLALIGLTGALLVFYYELEEVLHPALFTVAPQPGGAAAYRSLTEIEAAARAALPQGSKIGFGFYPRTDAGSYWLFAEVPAGNKADHWQVFVDPYTAQALGTRLVKPHDAWFARDFFSFVFELHYQLLLPWEIGGPIVGIMALATLVSLGIGIYLWWPKNGKWGRALRFKRGASRTRFVFDLHNLSGVYLLPVLVAVLVSGLYFNLPDQFFWTVNRFSPGTQNRYEIKSAPPAAGAVPIGLQRAFDIVRARYPEGRPDWLYIAKEPDATYTICAKDVPGLSAFADRRCVVVDQYTGAILWTTEPGAHTGGNTFVAWQWPLHSGTAFGLPGRILVLLSGLALPVLFVTGFIRWRQKVRARRIVAARQPRIKPA
ncbi:MAG TPA: PepSY-associated TM helix domain-containing protein [Candidatus Macondimonas sp.]|nr:PepSY-associated TM helix domain-containing protein [Candidatus Macondimonas sp.]